MNVCTHCFKYREGEEEPWGFICTQCIYFRDKVMGELEYDPKELEILTLDEEQEIC